MKERQRSHLLHVSVCGLPHVVVLYDTSQRLPWQLHTREESGGGQGGKRGNTESKLMILISHVPAIWVHSASCLFMSERHRDHRRRRLAALLGSELQTRIHTGAHI